MFIAGSYMLYSSPPNFSTATAAVTTSTVLTGRTSSVNADSKKLSSGFSVSDILDSRSDTDDGGEDDDDADSDQSDRRRRHRHVMAAMQRPKVAACVVVTRAESPKSIGICRSSSSPPPPSLSPSSSLSSSPPSPPVNKSHRNAMAAAAAGHQQQNRETLSMSTPSPIRSSPKMPITPPILSSQLKFGVDRILAKDDHVIPNRKDFPSSCTVCVSPFTSPPQPPLPPPPPPPPSVPQLSLARSRTVPCECMHPLCDGTGLFPAVYAYNPGLMYPACTTLYPSTHHLSASGNEVMLNGARVSVPNFMHPRPLQHHHQQQQQNQQQQQHLHILHPHNHPQVTGHGQYMNGGSFSTTTGISHHHHHHHGNGSTTATSGSKRKRSWSRAVFSNLQRKGLEKRFQIQKYITKPDRRQLAATLGLTDAQVKVWFQNRRMKWRHSKEAKEEFARNNNNGGSAGSGNGTAGTGTSKNDEQQLQVNSKQANKIETQKPIHINKDGVGSKMAAK